MRRNACFAMFRHRPGPARTLAVLCATLGLVCSNCRDGHRGCHSPDPGLSNCMRGAYGCSALRSIELRTKISRTSDSYSTVVRGCCAGWPHRVGTTIAIPRVARRHAALPLSGHANLAVLCVSVVAAPVSPTLPPLAAPRIIMPSAPCSVLALLAVVLPRVASAILAPCASTLALL